MSKTIFSELPQLGLIRFSGDDAQAFLHTQLSCDVAALITGRSTYGAYCTPKGRVLASFLLWRTDQGFFMQLPSSLREPIQKQLSKFILRAKVKAADVSGEWMLIGVAGKDAASLVRRLTGQAPQEAHEVAHAADATVIRLPGDRYEIAAAKAQASRILDGLAAGAEKTGAETWDRLDILSGIPTIAAATQEAFVPQMVNLDLIGGVSFEKGCYPGQEIVARMHYRGTLKQRMYLAHVPGAERPQAGDKLYSAAFGEQSCGTIVNAAAALDGGSDVLAVIQIAAGGTSDVRWKEPGGTRLVFSSLPYRIS
jgi:hypothetical protein